MTYNSLSDFTFKSSLKSISTTESSRIVKFNALSEKIETLFPPKINCLESYNGV